MDAYSIYSEVLKTILRHFLTGICTVLAAWGVNTDQQHTLVETTIYLVVPIVGAVLVQLWSYVDKRWIPPMIEKAFQANPATTTLPELKQQAIVEAKGAGA